MPTNKAKTDAKETDRHSKHPSSVSVNWNVTARNTSMKMKFFFLALESDYAGAFQNSWRKKNHRLVMSTLFIGYVKSRHGRTRGLNYAYLCKFDGFGVRANVSRWLVGGLN